MGTFIRHTACVKCGSSDANAIYEDGSTYCFSCGKADGKSSVNKTKTFIKEDPKTMTKESKPAITEQEYKEFKERTQIDSNNFRGIRDETYAYFGVRHLMDVDDMVMEQYYTITQDGQPVGIKIREIPKTFRSIARTGSECDLFMQFRFNRGGKYVIVTEGELDALSAYQMLNDYNKRKGSEFETAAVSATTGAQSVKQIANAYKFLDSFENIILCMDNDKAGQEAIEDLVKVMPKGKVKIMKMRMKDPNEYLTSNREKEFLSDFYNAEPYVPVGVMGSGELYNKIVNQAKLPKFRFPHFMKGLNDMFPSGVPLGHIVNIGAGTGLGKTSFVNEMIYDWIFHSPYKIGIVSMELDAGQYGEVMLSRHLSRKLSLIPDENVKQRLIESDETREKANELFMNGEEHRFYLLDNRDGTIEELQNTIEEMIVSCGCQIIVLDPLQDVLDGLTNDEQAVFMKWLKGMIKSHKVTFILINHMRKSQAGASHGEEDFHGSSTIIKSASANIILQRDKNHDDLVERNTTYVFLVKNRICGLTGPAGAVFYDNETHTLHDKDEYFSGHS